MQEYTIEYWANGQYNYDVKIEAENIEQALYKAEAALSDAGHAGAADRGEYRVLYND